MSLAEAMQHTENRKSMEISTAFAGQVGQYIKRVYINMAIELFGKTASVASADGFVLTDADFAAYNPGDFFTQTEMVDTVPRLDRVFTEDRLELLAEGIPVTELPASLQPWPTNLTNLYDGTRTDATIGGGIASAASTRRDGRADHPRRRRARDRCRFAAALRHAKHADTLSTSPCSTGPSQPYCSAPLARSPWRSSNGRRGEREPTNGRIYARATDLAEIGARLVSLEPAHHTLRAEIRADMKDLQEMIQQSLLQSLTPEPDA